MTDDVLTELKTLVAAGDYKAARDLARARGHDAAARVFDSLCEREETIRSSAKALIGKQATFATKRGEREGRVATVNDTGIDVVTTHEVRGMGTAEMRLTISWPDLTPQAENRLAKGWQPEGADAAMARAVLSLQRGDKDEAKQQLDSASDHPLAPLVRTALGLAETPEPEHAASQPLPEEPGWTTIFDGADTKGWRLIGPDSRAENGAFTGGGLNEFHYRADWREFILDCEVKGEVRTPVHFLSISLNQWDMMGTSSRVRLAFYGDGDAHLKIGTTAAAAWRAGAGKLPLTDWTRVTLEIREGTLAISRNGAELGRVDVSKAPVREGGVAFFTKENCTVRIRNVRVKFLSP